MAVTNEGRWEQYLLLRGQRVNEFWKEHLSASRDVLLIIGRGFDPRMCMGLEVLLEAGGQGRRDVVGLDFREGPMSPSLDHKERVEKNWATVTAAVGSQGGIKVCPVEFWSPEGRRISSQSARDLFDSEKAFAAYTDVVVDISSMPRSVYFPLIARILYLLDHQPDSREAVLNLHVLVAEDPGLDASIREEGIDEKADFMAAFSGGFDEEAIQTPKVWLPMLGENRLTQFDRIHDRVKPDEICPVLPSPSRDPRRADEIVINYRERLFDQHRLDGRDFIYAAERNPFEVYRQLRRALKRYDEVFNLLGGCRVAISPLSSKLMSLGALLVAYELKEQGPQVGICHIEGQGYALAGEPPEAELFGLWLAGECDAN